MTPAPVEAEIVPAWDEALRDVLAGVGLRTVYQPIVDLARLTVVGYEALSRFDHPAAPGRGPDDWFAAATERGLGPSLDAAAIGSALARRADLPPDCFLSVNVDPHSLAHPEVRAALAATGNLSGIVVEITEHRPWDPVALEPALDWLRGDGALIAVDDAGAGYAGLQQILELRPSLLKLDRALVAGLDRDEAKAALVEMLGVFANRVDAWLLAEGVETVAEARRLQAIGVPLAQGYLLGRPAPAWAPLAPGVAGELEAGGTRSDPGLRHLLSLAPSALVGDPVPAGPSWDGEPWVVVVDADQRPHGLVDESSSVTGVRVEALRANVSSTPAEVAHRIATTGADPSVPVIVTDNAGRYLGVVTITALLVHLAR